jgi:glycosyltransferase involved in cell wall biosynthesis
MEAYSILMSVYEREDPDFFDRAIASMLNQSVVTNDFVIVCDGPLTEGLEYILKKYDQANPGVFQIIRIPINVGIGAAANIGLKECKNDLVAKMDADDLSLPERCEMQLKMFAANPELTVLGGQIEEFDSDPDQPYAKRCVPAEHEEILKFGRRRQPFNNQTVMYRKSAVLEVGGYSDLPRNEDYDLYARLLASGYYAENIPQPLVKVRVDADATRRRASGATLVGCVRSRWRAYRIGYASLGDFLYCVIGQFVIFLCPGRLQNKIYAKKLRSTCK